MLLSNQGFHHLYPEPASAPTFTKSKITTLPTSLDLHWSPPPNDSINGEFLGYVLTYQPVNRGVDERQELEVFYINSFVRI